MAGRFLDRTATETDVVDCVRAAGVSVEVVEGVREAPESVRSRLTITLLRQTCGHGSAVGYWTNDASITLDAPGCPEPNGFELQAVAGRHIIEDVHLGYAAVAASCRDEGRVIVVGVGDDQEKWVKCDPSYEWWSITGSRYRLVPPFDEGPSRVLPPEPIPAERHPRSLALPQSPSGGQALRIDQVAQQVGDGRRIGWLSLEPRAAMD